MGFALFFALFSAFAAGNAQSQGDLVPSPVPYMPIDRLDDQSLGAYQLRMLEEDKTVGTALAPTTPGGKCLGSSDYGIWKEDGYDNFGVDMQACAESCTGKLVPVNCPIFQVCDKFPYRTCVTDCMKSTSTEYRADIGLISGPYSANCSACMGSLSQCVVDKCTSKCITGEQSPSCEKCTVDFCTDDFMICSGLNPERAHAEVDAAAILGGVLGGAGALVIGSLIFACLHFKKTNKTKELSVEDLAKLAAAQQQQAAFQAQQTVIPYPQQQKITQQDVVMMMQQAQQYGIASPSNPTMMNQNMTPYQQQYMMQQQQQYQDSMQVPMLPPGLMQSAPQIHIPSMKAQNMFQNQMSDSKSDIVAQTIELQVTYDFVGERDDELTCRKGELVHGIEENDGWWLAKSLQGRIGLIPSSYVAIKDLRIGGKNF